MAVLPTARRTLPLPPWLLAAAVALVALFAHPAPGVAAAAAGIRVGASTLSAAVRTGPPSAEVADRQRGNTPRYDGLASTSLVATDEGGSALEDVAASCHSFAAGTLVVLADGSTKAIDKVAVGDRVRTTDPVTGEDVVRTVTQLHLNHDTDLADVVVRDGAGREATVHTTQHHRFWDDSRRGWVDAGALLTGDQLHTDDGGAMTVVAVRSWTAERWMYDLTVDEVHTFYVVAAQEPVLVHNCGGMIGENGAQTTSVTKWTGKAGRIDVENPNPGSRPGQIHFQDWSGNKAMYNFENGAFFNPDGTPNMTAMGLLYNDAGFQNGVWKGLVLLGEAG